ncbi:MAG TPA: hypothetical protein VJC03_06385, partial [bacterium]|nr:hypothetical protein [bacterium]
MRRLWIGLFLAGLLLGSLALSIYLSVPLLKEKISSTLLSLLKQKISSQLTFKRLETNFISRAYLHEVTLPDYRLTVGKVELRYSLLNYFLKNKPPLLIFHRPMLELHAGEFPARKMSFAAPALKIRVREGSVRVVYGRQSRLVEGISGSLFPEIGLKLRTASGSSLVVREKNNILNVTFSPLRLDDIFPVLGISGKGAMEGRIELEKASLFGMKPVFLDGEGKAELSLEHPAVSIDKASFGWTANGGVFSFSGITAKSGNLELRGKGSITNPAARPLIDFDLTLAGNLKNQQHFGKTGGKVEAIAKIKGKMNSPYVFLKTNISDVVAGDRPAIQGGFTLFYNRYSRPQWELEDMYAVMGKGKITGHGSWGKRGDLEFTVEQMRLSHVLGYDLPGKVSGSVMWKKEGKAVEFTFPLKLEETGFWPDMEGRCFYVGNKGGWNLVSSDGDYLFSGLLSKRKKEINFSDIRFLLYGNGIIRSSGSWKKEGFRFEIDASDVAARDFSFFSFLRGREDLLFDFRGIADSRDKLTLEGFLSSRLAETREEFLTGKMLFSPRSLRLTSVSFREKLQGSLFYQKSPFVLQAGLETKGLYLEELFGSKNDLKGLLDMKFEMNWTGSRKEMDVAFKGKNISLKNIGMDGLDFSGRVEGEKFVITRCEGIKSSGTITGKGFCEIKKEGLINLAFQVNRYPAGGFLFTLPLEINARYFSWSDIEGELRASSFQANGKDLGYMKGNFIRHKKDFLIPELSLGKTRLKVSLGEKNEGEWRGDL